MQDNVVRVICKRSSVLLFKFKRNLVIDRSKHTGKQNEQNKTKMIAKFELVAKNIGITINTYHVLVTH